MDSQSNCSPPGHAPPHPPTSGTSSSFTISQTTATSSLLTTSTTPPTSATSSFSAPSSGPLSARQNRVVVSTTSSTNRASKTFLTRRQNNLNAQCNANKKKKQRGMLKNDYQRKRTQKYKSTKSRVQPSMTTATVGIVSNDSERNEIVEVSESDDDGDVQVLEVIETARQQSNALDMITIDANEDSEALMIGSRTIDVVDITPNARSADVDSVTPYPTRTENAESTENSEVSQPRAISYDITSSRIEEPMSSINREIPEIEQISEVVSNVGIQHEISDTLAPIGTSSDDMENQEESGNGPEKSYNNASTPVVTIPKQVTSPSAIIDMNQIGHPSDLVNGDISQIENSSIDPTSGGAPADKVAAMDRNEKMVQNENAENYPTEKHFSNELNPHQRNQTSDVLNGRASSNIETRRTAPQTSQSQTLTNKSMNRMYIKNSQNTFNLATGNEESMQNQANVNCVSESGISEDVEIEQDLMDAHSKTIVENKTATGQSKRPLLKSNSEDVELKNQNSKSDPPPKKTKPTVDSDFDSDEEVLKELSEALNKSFHGKDQNSAEDTLPVDNGDDQDSDEDSTAPIRNNSVILTPSTPIIASSGNRFVTGTGNQSTKAVPTSSAPILGNQSTGVVATPRQELRRSERRTRCTKNMAEGSSDDSDDDDVSTVVGVTPSSAVPTGVINIGYSSLIPSAAATTNGHIANGTNPPRLPRSNFRKRSRSNRPVTPIRPVVSESFEEMIRSRNRGYLPNKWRFSMINYGSMHSDTRGNIPAFSFLHRFHYAKIHNNINKQIPLMLMDKRHVVPFHVESEIDYEAVMRVARVEHWPDYFNSTRIARRDAEFVFPWLTLDSILKLIMMATKISVDGAQVQSLDWRGYLNSINKLHESYECEQTRRRVFEILDDAGKESIRKLLRESGYRGNLNRI